MPKSGSPKTAECDDADELTRQGVDMLDGQLAFWAQGEWFNGRSTPVRKPSDQATR
jgi:hypothetical protein